MSETSEAASVHLYSQAHRMRTYLLDRPVERLEVGLLMLISILIGLLFS